MEIRIEKAILHIMDSNGMLPVYSQEELDLSDDAVCGFIVMHIKKVLTDDSSKLGVFTENSYVAAQVTKLENSFVDSSIAIAEHLFAIMKANADIPSADLLIALVRIDGALHVGIIKFNYKEGYTHYVDYNPEGVNNKIVVHKVLFASESQKNDEGAIVNLSDLSLRLIEKAYEINDEKKQYFSELFLECGTELSQRESIRAINTVAKEITKKYYNDNFQKVSAVKAAIYDRVEGEGVVTIDDIADTCFNDSLEIKEEYLTQLKEAGVAETIRFAGETPERKFNKHKIKTDNGIELSMPMDVYRNKELIEFTNNPDGTISIIIKNITKITNR